MPACVMMLPTKSGPSRLYRITLPDYWVIHALPKGREALLGTNLHGLVIEYSEAVVCKHIPAMAFGKIPFNVCGEMREGFLEIFV